MSFPAGAVRGRTLNDLCVSNAYFHATSVSGTALCRCKFANCHFERLDVDGTANISASTLDEACRIDSLVRVYGEEQDDQVTIFAPDRIRRELQHMGFIVGSGAVIKAKRLDRGQDDDLQLAQRFLRAFLRSTELNQSTIKMRLGIKASHFFHHLLPELRRVGVVTEVRYQGRGNQRRVKLAVPMAKIEEAMGSAGGEFRRFIQAFSGTENPGRR